jgi:hypothetical protein
MRGLAARIHLKKALFQVMDRRVSPLPAARQ